MEESAGGGATGGRWADSGPLMMVSASVLFAGMGLLVKIVSADVSAAQIVLWRSVFSLFPMLPSALRDPALWRARRVGPLIARSLSGSASMFCYFTAIARLHLGDAVLISYTSPLVVALLGPSLIGERSTPGLWRALALGLLGVALVARPSLDGDPVGLAAALATSGFAGVAYLYVRVSARTERSDTIVFWFAALSGALFAPVLLWEPLPRSPTTWAQLGVIGVVGLLAQLAMTRGYALGSASRMAVFTYLTPVIAYGAGVVALGEPPGWAGVIGTVLVAIAGVLATIRKDG